MIPGNINTDLISGDEGGYQISRSLRFNSADSAYLSRTPASAGNRKTWTWAGWVKRSALSKTSAENQVLLTAWTATSATGFFQFYFHNGDDAAYPAKLTAGTGAATLLITSQTFRDVAGWYHIVLSVDTTQATAADRMKIYVNGVQVTQFQINAVSANVSQNSDLGVNAAGIHVIGARTTDGSSFIWHQDGYLADIHFIDGQALTPSSFAETNATTGQWVPKAYTGSYGTNGFRLDFSDNSAATATTLGKDYSGNSNNWTPNNLSVTAGAGNDSLVDTPTSYGTDTGAGGEVRGNYCTWNPLRNVIYPATTTNGNLELSVTSGYLTAAGSISVSTGKWYWEMTLLQRDTVTPNYQWTGVVRSTDYSSGAERIFTGTNSAGVQYWGINGNLNNTQSYGATFTTGDVIGVAFDVDAGSITFYKNGVSQGASTFNLVAGASYYPSAGGGENFKWAANWGARPFAYTAPSGFKALCDTNLPAPVVAKPNTAFDVALWTGNGSARSITGLNFNPDFVWIKGRSGATDHALYDVVRGTEKRLESNNTDTEVTSDGGVTAFNSDGFSLGTLAQVNTNSSTYVGWAWDAGSSTVTNTQGSITSQVRANPSAGFSIVTYTGNGTSGATIGHGLGVKPGFVIIKSRSGSGASYYWICYHSSLGATQALELDSTTGAFSAPGAWNNTEPTSSVISVAGNAVNNGSGSTYVAYCFSPVAGYSSMSSFLGNANADGPFQWCGFRPKLIIAKVAGATGGRWAIFDSARIGYNGGNNSLTAEDSAAENNYFLATDIDILSNGFKIRHAARLNASGEQVIWAAWAESPFAYSRAR